VIEGVEQVLEIDGPALSVSSPQAELYTYGEQVTVAGTADDDVEVASVSVNGSPVEITSTGNTEQPHQVSFSVPFPLAKGPNKIVVKATDSANKIAQDTRFVYRDSGPPILAFTPATSTISDASVTVRGTASDDNVVSQVFVNGLAVPYSPSGNPADPNEVAFTNGAVAQGRPQPHHRQRRRQLQAHDGGDARRHQGGAGRHFPDLPASLGRGPGAGEPEGTAYVLAVPVVTDDRDPRLWSRVTPRLSSLPARPSSPGPPRTPPATAPRPPRT